jgi:RimJ/RimL family protein N-acetyltransferase
LLAQHNNLPFRAKESGKDIDAKQDDKTRELIPIGFLIVSRRTGDHSVQPRYCDLGITMAKDYQGKGYGPEAINWALDWAFIHAALHSVRLICFSYNTNARKVYERLGFVLEGRKRECLWVNGGWHDTLLHSMLDREWKKLREGND